ncbi:hypothetical protein [Leifsonia shinshuensis]|uniref:Uncharacterized protein n=1 Tax=Leifsonia shinshuensis TaxID=150026 RepID=A0A7G6Y7Z2_9MICO|nr:hypothetical protein [Leifsonia shinshuensis]QNE34607.1 hypothetical protein F1C12_05365 [Leifsonia shinshuensis]
MSSKFARAWIATTAAALLLSGCSAAASAPTGGQPSGAPPAASGSPGATAPASRDLAVGAFTPANGVSGRVAVESADGALVLTLDSFHSGADQLRLLLVDADPAELASCVPEAAATASVGGTPGGPASRFPFASASELGSTVPRFAAVVVVRQHRDGDPDCTEPVVAVAPLTWS